MGMAICNRFGDWYLVIGHHDSEARSGNAVMRTLHEQETSV
jgi:hypothetical protein